MATEAELIEKIESVLGKFPGVFASWTKKNVGGWFTDRVAWAALSMEVTNLANFIYGEGSSNANRIIDQVASSNIGHLEMAEGMLRGTLASIQHGLLADLRTQVLLDVQEDFIEAARNALNSGNKDVAAALLSVVLEDSVKRLAERKGCDDLLGKEYSFVVTNLFSRKFISKSTKGALLSFKDLRNSALHAQWNEVSIEAVNLLLLFLPGFIEAYEV